MTDVDTLMDEVEQDEIEQRARRPHGSVQVCRNCVYWEIDRGIAEKLASEAATSPIFSDVRAECHRHAPRTSEYVLTHIARLLGNIAWAVEETANIKHEDRKYDDIYNADCIDENEVDTWPRTMAQGWCGDFVERPK